MSKRVIEPLIDYAVASAVSSSLAAMAFLVSETCLLLYMAYHEQTSGWQQRNKLLALATTLGLASFFGTLLVLRVMFGAINRRHVAYMELEYAKLEAATAITTTGEK